MVVCKNNKCKGHSNECHSNTKQCAKPIIDYNNASCTKENNEVVEMVDVMPPKLGVRGSTPGVVVSIASDIFAKNVERTFVPTQAFATGWVRARNRGRVMLWARGGGAFAMNRSRWHCDGLPSLEVEAGEGGARSATSRRRRSGLRLGPK